MAENSTVYYLLIKVYADSTKGQKIKGTWESLIHYAMGASMVAGIAWTRHQSVGGIVRSYDFYSDMFNEGIIVLADEEKIKTFE